MTCGDNTTTKLQASLHLHVHTHIHVRTSCLLSHMATSPLLYTIPCSPNLDLLCCTQQQVHLMYSYLYTSKNYLESSALASFPVVCDFLKQQACMCTSLHFLQKVLCDSMGKESILNLCFSPFLRLHILSRFFTLTFFQISCHFSLCCST